MKTPAFVGLDWGTTHLRAYLLDAQSQILDSYQAQQGIKFVPPGKYETVLEQACGAWMQKHPDIPILLSGMVGSRNGWHEVPYCALPAGLAEIAKACVEIPYQGHRCHFVSGLSTTAPSGAPDVIRGEEVQILGAIAALSLHEKSLICLPGTHSKWVMVKGSIIQQFATYMTGELYEVLSEHSLLKALMAPPDQQDPMGFNKGLEHARQPGGLSHLLYAARSKTLFDQLKPAEVAPFVSGVLIGSEVLEVSRTSNPSTPLVLLADGPLAALYSQALDAFEQPHQVLPTQQTTLMGWHQIIQHLGDML